jgi:uncharacterized membrane protein YkvA (DUF1232 family)
MLALTRLLSWARAIKQDVHALYLAAHDPRVPRYVKALALAIAIYALSPIDLIPDFIPVLGLLDEAILLPLALKAVIRLVPPAIMAEHRARAAATQRRTSRAGAAIVVAMWIGFAALLLWLFWPESAS